jgi:thymidylate synthase (FAD)
MTEKGDMIKCLDKGHVRIVDWMGSDQSIEQAARISYGEETRPITDTRNLIRYLMRHRHTSPFEMPSIIFQIKLPIFVMRQHIRHRTASVNEYSMRYSEAIDDFYIPEQDYLQKQSTENKQGGLEKITGGDANDVMEAMAEQYEKCLISYNFLLKQKGLSRELSRIVLPVAGYTECYWKMDLSNLFHYFSLRMDSHAQKEIQVYATAMYDLIKPLFPLSCEAFQDYRYQSYNLSRMEKEIIQKLLKDSNKNSIKEMCKDEKMNKREIRDFIEMIESVGCF